ncbi:hypothetical protein [Pyxidicoccus sp. MSG2]|uniref:hypothetical protein n=1 Tax=Pyxidicoccus sp. MSG2 TaxID=2996790 RepID=UPI00226ED7DB|nr:hypothetical protein [Pyxidicoccus sp. MSG2]MCY1015227.1 hypothetical protein [Pyxidicoccus sp. MSG2]
MKLTAIERSEWDGRLRQQAGAEAQIWLYHVTFKRLLLKVFHPKEEQAVYALALGCTHMEGPFNWSQSAIEVIETEAGGPQEPRYWILDRANGFRLSCSSVVLYEGAANSFFKTFDDLVVE